MGFGFTWLADARRDVGYAARTLWRTPGFTAVAVVTLALGIGAATIIYSVVRNVLLDPFPYVHSQRMVDVIVRDAAGRILRGPLPAAEFLDYQEQNQVFEDVAGAIGESMHWVSDAGAERLSVVWITPNTFRFLGVSPLMGRVFGSTDAASDALDVAVLNHRTWVTLFAADPEILGRTIVLNGAPRTIVGVMPPRFEWHVADLWIPGPLNRADDPKSVKGSRWFQARLRPGVTVEEAAAQMNVIAARRARDYPQEYPENSRIQVITVIDWVVGQFRRVLYTLFAAVGLLLVIACCNVANMLLARATAREREIAMRAALGASRGRIVRQLLVESVLLAAGGALAGTLLAYGGIAGLARLMPRQGVAWETELRLDQPVLLFALAIAALATLAFGLFPALHSVRRELVGGTNIGGRSGTAGRSQTRMRNSLVVAEVALSMVLLLGAGLLVQSFIRLVGVDLGIDPRNLLVTGVAFAPGQYQSAAEQRRFYRQALERIETIPGVMSAAVSSGPPPFGGMRTDLIVPGMAAPQSSSGSLVFCSERFFDTIGLKVLMGRSLSTADVETSRQVALVNETLARQYFGAQPPIGRTIRVSRLASLPTPIADPTFEIIGVVPDTANQGVREPSAPQVYVPFTLRGPASLGLVLRTANDPMRYVNALRREVLAIDRQVAIVQPSTLESLVQRVFYAQPRFSLIVLGMFASTGLALVVLGVYGVLAYTVSQQGREIAIRMALGGDRRHVLKHVFRMGLQLLGTGVVIGLAASMATNRLLVNQLWRTSPYDPVILTAVTVIVVGVGLCACWVPARRAVRVEPIAALRHE
jgi:putative ABC transport system permease protein